MVRFSMLMMTTFLVGLFMFAAGAASIFKGLNMHQSGDEQTGTLVTTVGVVLLVFGPVVMVLSAVYYTMRAKQIRDAGHW